jgi:hypothetical protein
VVSRHAVHVDDDVAGGSAADEGLTDPKPYTPKNAAAVGESDAEQGPVLLAL